MPVPIYHVDAFSRVAFGGNPAAVCFLEEPRPEAWMQSVAAEMNLSETAFVYAGEGQYRLRWFTPLVEVDLCGHATLAAAHVLWESGRVKAGQDIEFLTNSGVLTTQQVDHAIRMNFPVRPARPCDAPAGLIDALGVEAVEILKSDTDFLVVLANESRVRDLQPDLCRLKQLPMRGLIVTAMSDRDEHDFVSRFFAPGVGVDEDPVTGSAHCTLLPYWAAKLSRTQLRARQLSRRGGQLELSLEQDRVNISGVACTVLQGQLYAD